MYYNTDKNPLLIKEFHFVLSISCYTIFNILTEFDSSKLNLIFNKNEIRKNIKKIYEIKVKFNKKDLIMSGMLIKIQGKKTNINKFRNNLKNILFINTIFTIVILIIN